MIHPEVSKNNSRDRRIPGLDGLRAIAFLMVFVSHKAPVPGTEALGSAAVWLFFVLSGFLITMILGQAREDVEARNISISSALKIFYLRRTARIMPVYYLFLTVVSVLSAYHLASVGELGRQLANWLYLSNFYIEFHGWATDLGHLWSLAVEEQFYLLFAPLLLFIDRRHHAKICIILICISVLAHIIYYVAGAKLIVFDVDTAANIGLLALGGLCAINAELRLPHWLTGDCSIVLVLASYIALPIVVADTGLWPIFGRLSGFLAALLLLQIFENQTSRIVRILDMALIREIGLISYGAYLFHTSIHADRILSAVGFDGHLRYTLGLAVELGITLLLAELSWRIIERPARFLLLAGSVDRRRINDAGLQS
jgi:peptidoglycan/LPS O-acetylase OafA/YrhL